MEYMKLFMEYKMGVEPKTAIFNDYLENWQWTTKIMMMQKKHFIKIEGNGKTR